MRKVERKSTFSNKFWLCCSFFHQTRNLSWIHTKQINQSARCISSTRNKFFLRDRDKKLIAKVKNVKHRPKACNETMLHDKWRNFLSGISPPQIKLKQRNHNREVGLDTRFFVIFETVLVLHQLSNHPEFKIVKNTLMRVVLSTLFSVF